MHQLIWSVYFFFSSRRRHTSSLCDWSSDVCSSDLHLDAQRGPGLCAVTAHASQRDHFFQRGRPCCRGGFAHLPPAAIDGNRDARGDTWHLRRRFYLVVERLHFVPVDFQANERPLGAFLRFLSQRPAPAELLLLQ